MSWSMSSEHLELLIAGYVLGDLDSIEATEFEQLLQNHPELAQEVEQMQQALESYQAPETAPPPRLRGAILDAHAQSIRAEVTPPIRAKVHRSWFSWDKVLYGAAAVMIAALGINNYQLRQTLQRFPSANEQATRTYTLQGTAIPASATIKVNPNNLQGTLTVKNLPPLPPGKVYVVWTVPKQYAPVTMDDRGAILTGVFTVDAQGNVSQAIDVPTIYRDPAMVSRVAITIEDAAAPQRHQGQPILTTTVS